MVEYGLSDHSLIYATREIQQNVFKCHNTVKIRSLKTSKVSLIESMNQADWSTVLKCGDIDKAWVHFKSIFKKLVDMMTPIKIIRIKQRAEPWVTDDILKLIGLRNVSFAENWR